MRDVGEKLVGKLSEGGLWLSDWKVLWVGTCAVLRTATYLMKQDAQSCLNKQLKAGLQKEFGQISENRGQHKIFWEFVFKERNSLLKEYHWSAYEAYLDENGEELKSIGLLATAMTAKESQLRIHSGAYKGHLALEVLEKAIEWAEERIKSAVENAGLALDQKVHFQTWQEQPTVDHEDTILGHVAAEHGNNNR